jgi:hypothetical protein
MTEQPVKLLELVYVRADAFNLLWMLYIAVAAAVLGLLASGSRLAASLQFKGLLTLAFLAFAASHFWALWINATQREAMLTLFTATDYWQAALTARPPPIEVYATCHAVFDLVVIGCILGVPWQVETPVVAIVQAADDGPGVRASASPHATQHSAPHSARR